MYDIQPLANTVLPHAVRLVVFAVKYQIFSVFCNLTRRCGMGTVCALSLRQILVYLMNGMDEHFLFYTLYCMVIYF